jgi:hypothetical protein
MTKENIVDKFRVTKFPDEKQLSFTIRILKVQLLNNHLYDNLPPFREKDGNCYYEFYVKAEADAFFEFVVPLVASTRMVSISKLYS